MRTYKAHEQPTGLRIGTTLKRDPQTRGMVSVAQNCVNTKRPHDGVGSSLRQRRRSDDHPVANLHGRREQTTIHVPAARGVPRSRHRCPVGDPFTTDGDATPTDDSGHLGPPSTAPPTSAVRAADSPRASEAALLY